MIVTQKEILSPYLARGPEKPMVKYEERKALSAPLPSIVTIEISQVSRNDRFAVAN